MAWLYSIFGYPLGWVMWACFKVIPIYGVALLLFTIIVRACLVAFDQAAEVDGEDADLQAPHG